MNKDSIKTEMIVKGQKTSVLRIYFFNRLLRYDDEDDPRYSFQTQMRKKMLFLIKVYGKYS